MKLIRKLMLSTLAAGALSVTLAVTTYAWYKTNNAAFTEDFTFQASAGDGFLISVDGVHYKHKLTSEDIMGAALHEYDPVKYSYLKNGKIDDTNFKTKKYINEDTLEEVSKKNNLSEEYADTYQLMPVTSFDGSNILNLASTQVKLNLGKYMQFAVYFKTLSNAKDDNQKYKIYLDGNDYKGKDGNASRTKVWSDNFTKVNLQKDMMTYDLVDGVLTPKELKASTEEEPSFVTVHTSNASRFSIEDLGYKEEVEETVEETIVTYEENPEDPDNPIEHTEVVTHTKMVTRYSNEALEVPKALIYELSENRNGTESGQGKDLGSYATNYNGLDEIGALYNSTYNAMYTYYNNIRPNDTLESRLLDYESKPQTIRDLNGEENKPFMEIESGYIHKAVLRFWIDGWDADCFDGLPGYIDDNGEVFEANPINVCLLFNSIKE